MSSRTARIARALSQACLIGLVSTAAWADVTDGLSEGAAFTQKDGESLFKASCQGCHMPEGQGAQGAGMYPALARNTKLAAGIYPAYTVLNGRKGMPSFRMLMTDQQIAEVTNYVRTHLGNSYKDAVTAADVKALR